MALIDILNNEDKLEQSSGATLLVTTLLDSFFQKTLAGEFIMVAEPSENAFYPENNSSMMVH